MNISECLKELQYIQALRQKVEKSLRHAPEGRLRCHMSKGKHPQYYHVIKNERDIHPQGRYLKKEENNLAVQLAQKDYDQKMMKLLAKKEAALLHFLSHYDSEEKSTVYDRIDRVYQDLPEGKRRLVTPYAMPIEKYIEQWYQSNQGDQNTIKKEYEYLTERGDKVRSKSEKIIADKLFYKKIPYVYEAPLLLTTGTVYPDFSVLNVNNRKTFYIEHLGMLDDQQYCKKALLKLETYARNNILIGEKLLLTMESSLKGISVEHVELLIEHYLK